MYIKSNECNTAVEFSIEHIILLKRNQFQASTIMYNHPQGCEYELTNESTIIRDISSVTNGICPTISYECSVKIGEIKLLKQLISLPAFVEHAGNQLHMQQP